ncbi:uncharacterized protein ATNIH1004_002071 [Aspergillus tanneri]|uniref:Uncharacterized protein n=1 Tax=Aspergillus tanneri TaxID=1220188 RepID=A0A5M9M713_9EURO|nr:uncharacterized protein ATNIH1004_002071 [Aspergillus tanneri]KAA8641270.1 hypothetical protein ATNIH1004_002071 [Aspergillus tanneri]
MPPINDGASAPATQRRISLARYWSCPTALLAFTGLVACAQAGDNTDVSPARGDGRTHLTLPTFSDSATPPGSVTLAQAPWSSHWSPPASGTDGGTAAGTGASSGTQTGTGSSSTASPTGSGSSSGVSSSPARARAQAPQPAVVDDYPFLHLVCLSPSDTSSTTSDGSSRTSSGTGSPSASPSGSAAARLFVDKNWARWMLLYLPGVGLAL